ncbi:hypothetical protein H311_02343 [Anncaliia algerae PRA109]|nr:hypothetical protein H311_02343 [Anncaliia algerae PRA109]
MLISKFLRNTVKHGFYYWKVMVKLETCNKYMILSLKYIESYFNLQEFTNFYMILLACTFYRKRNDNS